MDTAHLHDFCRNLTRGMAAATLEQEPDRRLVERFLAQRDEAAFEALTRRHGPMVYRVCWRVLQQPQDVEDAFQATFLVLARKPASVRKLDSVASWLHGVARRVSLKAKAHAVRPARQRSLPDSQGGPADETTWKELRTVLDDELAELPEKWRLPLILCYLEGKTQDEAAGQLAWSKNTLRRRLDEARTALGRRLRRRGIVGPATFAAAMLSDCVVSAALPGTILTSTVDAACQVASGQGVKGVVSTKIAALAEGVLKTMLLSKLKIVAAIGLILAVATVGVNALVQQTRGALADDRVVKARPAGSPQTEAEQVRKKTDAVRREREKLAGTWRLVSAEANGTKISKETIEENLRPKINWLADLEGRKRPAPAREIALFLMHDGEGKWQQRIKGDTTFTYMDCDGTSAIDPTTNPRTIDLTVTGVPEGHEAARQQDPGAVKKGQVKQGIYEFVGADTCRICFAPPGKERPTNFSTKLNKDLPVLVFQRVQFEDFVEFNFGGGGVGGTGVRDKGGFTVVSIVEPGKATTKLCVSIAVKEEEIFTKFRVLAVDGAGKRHEPVDKVGAAAGGRGVGVVTQVVEFNLASDKIKTLVIQKRDGN